MLRPFCILLNNLEGTILTKTKLVYHDSLVPITWPMYAFTQNFTHVYIDNQ